MARTFTFTLNTPTATQDPQDAVKCYESDDGSAPWTLVESAVAISSLPESAGTYTYVVAGADAAKYHILSPVSASLQEYDLAVQKVIPPVAADATLFTAYINVAEIDGDDNAGIVLEVKHTEFNIAQTPVGTVVIGNETTVTDVNGFASLTVVADIGNVTFQLNETEVTLDTTGLGGTAVDLSALF